MLLAHTDEDGFTTRFTFARGTPATPYRFDKTNGESANAGFVQATNGNCRPDNPHGGADCVKAGCRTVSEITPGAKPTDEQPIP